MEASIVDLRYKMKEVLKALDRHEKVTILHHGKARGTIVPPAGKGGRKVADHPFFGMNAGSGKTVEDVMAGLRGGRTDAV